MKVFIAGGTGLLGYHAALECLSQGDEVRAMAIADTELGDWYPKQIELTYGDLFALSEDALVPMIKGCEGFVYALGPDDRVTPPAPAYEFFHTRLVEHCAKAMRAAKRAGVKKCVVLNSYFAYFDRLWPDLKLAAHHPYIRCRVEQAEAVLSQSDGMTVCVLELPYIFGTMPSRTPIWKHVVVDRIRSMKTVLYPKGGSSMISVKLVGEAIYGGIHYATQSGRYPVGDVNMEWKEMLTIMLNAMGQHKKIIYLPKFIVRLQGKTIQAEHQKENKESGLDPLRLFDDIMCKFLYFDPEPSRAALCYGKGGIREAIEDTIHKSL
jgi:nucleoside-diphosphate-sugar epimerase